MRFARDRRFLVSIQRDSKGTPAVVYDLKREKIDNDLTAYGGFLIRDKLLDIKTVEGAMYQICRFKEYVARKKWILSELNDERLENFRDDLLTLAKQRARRHGERVAKSTVNAGLLAIYPWLRWMKDTARASRDLIGPFPCRILSEQRNSGRRTFWTTPLVLRNSGSKSRHKLPGFVPDKATRIQVLKAIHANASTPYVAHRNALFQRVLETVGMRRASTLSLTTEQFRRDMLDAEANKSATRVDVTPSEQKFGYEDQYVFPMALAYEICGFVEGSRKDLVSEKGWNERTTGKAVFISATTGKPLQPRSMTAIFSKLMRATGAPPGAAVHAWRHRYFHDDIEKEIEYRAANGLDTRDDAVAAAVSLRGGQKNPESLLPYVASMHAARRANKRS